MPRNEHTQHEDRSYVIGRHSAVRTSSYVFNQLIPYIGNKRKLLDLITMALGQTEPHAGTPVFLDLFSGSGVVARLAKTLGYQVIANDWEPYSEAINGCAIACNHAPAFAALDGYDSALNTLNSLAPRVDWITEHLCPRDDNNYDTAVDRMFFMRKNGLRLDAIRHQISEWFDQDKISLNEQNCLLAPLLYQTCYRSNTSGVFKGFHNGWGGKTSTALYRIAGDLLLSPSLFYDNGLHNEVLRDDAQAVASTLAKQEVSVAYLDPPYNQHPYGSNYHVLNSVALWDKPEVGPKIGARTKSAIRTDWRTERRSAYNYASDATLAYRRLIQTLNAHTILTSYSTDGTVPLLNILNANLERGHVSVVMKEYKRYRVSTQRFSKKPMNIEFIVVLDTHRKADTSAEELHDAITSAEQCANDGHPESG